VTVLSDSELLVTWFPPDGLHDYVTHYSVQYGQDFGFHEQEIYTPQRDKQMMHTYTITGLSSTKFYVVRVTAGNPVGFGPPVLAKSIFSQQSWVIPSDFYCPTPSGTIRKNSIAWVFLLQKYINFIST
jgi:hypothetical protein